MRATRREQDAPGTTPDEHARVNSISLIGPTIPRGTGPVLFRGTVDPSATPRTKRACRHARSGQQGRDAHLVDDEAWGRYLQGLKRLNARDRRLIVGRAELGYSYRQLAFTERLPSPEAARKAMRRALVRLLGAMPDP